MLERGLMKTRRFKPEDSVNCIYRYEFRHKGDSPIDYGYTTSEQLAVTFIKRECQGQGPMGGRNLNEPWYWFLWVEPLDKFDANGSIVNVFDWWGNEVDEVCQEVGWHYGKDKQPHHNEPFDDNCPACNEALIRDIEIAKAKFNKQTT
jgi:hypothetical protein